MVFIFLAGITLIAVGATLSIVPMIIGGIVLVAGSSIGFALGRI
jgi:hypothetical protein